MTNRVTSRDLWRVVLCQYSGVSMCGISGIYHPRDQKALWNRVIQKMNEALLHRGPDECGVYNDDCVSPSPCSSFLLLGSCMLDVVCCAARSSLHTSCCSSTRIPPLESSSRSVLLLSWSLLRSWHGQRVLVHWSTPDMRDPPIFRRKSNHLSVEPQK